MYPGTTLTIGMEVASKATSNLPNGLKTTRPSSRVCYHRRTPTVPECLLHPRWGSLELFWGDCCRRRTPTVHECSYHPQSAHSPGPSLGVCFRMKTPTAHGCSWHRLWETAKPRQGEHGGLVSPMHRSTPLCDSQKGTDIPWPRETERQEGSWPRQTGRREEWLSSF